jgi:uncharacterized protein YoxC
LSSAFDWAIVLDVGVGVGVLLCGIALLLVCSAMAKVVTRLNGTLDEVDQQIAALSTPVVKTLDHVGGIADSADATVARLAAVVGTLETVAASVGKTARLGSDALAPALVNVGAALTGVSAGLRKLVGGRRTENGAAANGGDAARETPDIASAGNAHG